MKDAAYFGPEAELWRDSPPASVFAKTDRNTE
jgi:hypothetical protein